MPDSNDPRRAWTDSERAMLDEHRARRAAEASRRAQADAEQAQEDDIRSATRAIFRLLAEHDKRIEALTVNGHTLATQIAEQPVGIQQLQERMPELVARGFIAAVSDPEAWVAGRTAMKQAARNAAGGALFGLLGGVVKQLWLVLLFLIVVYQTGGWSLLWAVLKLKMATP